MFNISINKHKYKNTHYIALAQCHEQRATLIVTLNKYLCISFYRIPGIHLTYYQLTYQNQFRIKLKTLFRSLLPEKTEVCHRLFFGGFFKI